jgi:hypothetical protein
LCSNDHTFRSNTDFEPLEICRPLVGTHSPNSFHESFAGQTFLVYSSLEKYVKKTNGQRQSRHDLQRKKCIRQLRSSGPAIFQQRTNRGSCPLNDPAQTVCKKEKASAQTEINLEI